MNRIRTSSGLYLAENGPLQNRRCHAQRGNGGKSTALVQDIVAQRPDVARITVEELAVLCRPSALRAAFSR